MEVALLGRAPDTFPRNTEVNPKEHVKAITTRNMVQLPEIHVKRSVANKEKVEMYARYLEANPLYICRPRFEELGMGSTKHLPSVQQPPKIELKQLPSYLCYAYLREFSTLHVIIANSISELEEEKLLRMLQKHKTTIG
ncbi:Uncharacterized protein Adt_11434 [Abeliophyllum distichum]|uniref:Uncharacterized protein n=1 Tax=Abeliophyllum distichum TaxID=126358 RepID=A0ABD1UMU6_9LAMI